MLWPDLIKEGPELGSGKQIARGWNWVVGLFGILESEQFRGHQSM